jgi:hypothetical protein
MAEMGAGYGSESHLLRYLGRHRGRLNREVLRATEGDNIEWLDSRFDGSRKWGDGERKGLDFLPPDSTAQSAWKAAWPRRGNPPNWDAVGRVRVRGVHEWLLVEAKANTEELESTCGASPEGGLDLITSTLRATKKALGVAADRDWLRGYYQFANRLAVLNILDSVGLPARLLLIYFVGDQNSGFTCPADQAQWRAALETQDRHLGISVRHRLADRVNKLFLEVSPMDAGNELTFS